MDFKCGGLPTAATSRKTRKHTFASFESYWWSICGKIMNKMMRKRGLTVPPVLFGVPLVKNQQSVRTIKRTYYWI
jgi:hypothetical protein